MEATELHLLLHVGPTPTRERHKTHPQKPVEKKKKQATLSLHLNFILQLLNAIFTPPCANFSPNARTHRIQGSGSKASPMRPGTDVEPIAQSHQTTQQRHSVYHVDWIRTAAFSRMASKSGRTTVSLAFGGAHAFLGDYWAMRHTVVVNN